MRKSFIWFLVLGLMLALAGCAKRGSEYLGKWQDPADPKSGTMEITRNGDNYLITLTTLAFGGKPQTTTVSAVNKDGLLHVDGAFGGATFTYVKDTDGLLVSGGLAGNSEMKRVK